MGTSSKNDKPPTAAYWQGLAAYPLPYQLGIGIIRAGIASDHLGDGIDGLSFPRGPLQLCTQLRRTFLGVALGHRQRAMPKQPTDHIKRHVFIDESHPHCVPKLMRLKMVQLSRLVTDPLLIGPFIEHASKRPCFERKLGRQGTWEKVLAGIPPSLTDIVLLCLNRRDDCLIHEGNDMLHEGGMS